MSDSVPPCFTFLHGEVVEFAEGRVTCRFVPSREMENPFGITQGGILAGMLDNVIGPAVYTVAPDRPSSTINLSVNYLRAAKTGEPLRGIAEVVKHGRTQAFIEARLERESDGALIAKATAVNVFLDRTPT